MKCPACGFDASTDSRFCPRCGARLTAVGDGTISVTKSLSPPGAHPPGSLFAGRYRIIGAAGEGGMGVEAIDQGRARHLSDTPQELAG